MNKNDEQCDCIAPESHVPDDWQTHMQIMLNGIIENEKLPENSLYLMTNYGRDGMRITSYSLGIYEPDYPLNPNAPVDPKRNSTVLNIKETNDGFELLVSSAAFESVGKRDGVEIKQSNSKATGSCVLSCSNDLKILVPYVQEIMKHALANYKSKASPFGCCDRFNKCSDLKRCVHDNLLFSKACIYRSNLEAGRIFYGKNRNID